MIGAYNRRILSNINSYSVIVLYDVDDFKVINDTYCHDVGDNVLKIVTKILMNNTRSTNIVCRYGGDEFLIIFSNCSKELVERRMHIASKLITDYFKNLNISVSFSVVISCYEEGKMIQDVIKNVDILKDNIIIRDCRLLNICSKLQKC